MEIEDIINNLSFKYISQIWKTDLSQTLRSKYVLVSYRYFFMLKNLAKHCWNDRCSCTQSG